METFPAITRIATQGEARVDYPRPDRLVEGNPRRETWTGYDNPKSGASIGIWACERGAWKIQFAQTKEEFFCVLEGRVRLHDQNGNVAEFGVGEAAVIPPGFTGMFEVVEPVRKYFCVVEVAL